jgi:hypothetical protein
LPPCAAIFQIEGNQDKARFKEYNPHVLCWQERIIKIGKNCLLNGSLPHVAPTNTSLGQAGDLKQK